MCTDNHYFCNCVAIKIIANPLALFTITTFLLVDPMKWKLCKAVFIATCAKAHNTMT